MVWYNAKFSEYLAFPHPLVISRASPYPRGCSVGALQDEPGLGCAHNGDSASLAFLNPLKMLHSKYSGVGLLSLSLSHCSSLDTSFQQVQLTLEHMKVSLS